MSKKNLKIILVVIAVILAGGIIYCALKLVRTTPITIDKTTLVDETTNWKVYYNSNYGFSFKYPANWEVRDQTSVNQKIDSSLKLLVGANPQNEGQDMVYDVVVFSGTVDIVAKKYKTSANNNSTIISDTTITKYGAQTRAIVIKNNITNLNYTTYYIQKGDNVFQLTGPSDGNGNDTTIANKIANTFEFAK